MNSINRPLGIGALSRRAADLDIEALAAQVLGFLAGDEERLVRFLSLTGFDPTSLRAEAETPGFTRAILTYLSEDEDLLVAFAHHSDLAPATLDVMLRRELERPRPPRG